MKNTISLFALSVISLFTISCKNDTTPEVKTIDTVSTNTITPAKTLNANATYIKAEFGIEGMTCAVGCAKAIEKKMAKMDGVKSAKVDFDRELAMVEYDEALVNPSALEETVKKVGDSYKVNNMKTVTTFSNQNK